MTHVKTIEGNAAGPASLGLVRHILGRDGRLSAFISSGGDGRIRLDCGTFFALGRVGR